MITAPVQHYDAERDVLQLVVGPLDNDRAAEVPGFTYHDGVWEGRATWAAALASRGVFGSELLLTEQANNWGLHQLDLERYAQMLKSGAWLDAGVPDWAGRLKVPYQAVGSALMAAQGTFLLWDEPGAGKTPQAEVALKLLGASDDDAFPALVVTTKSMLLTWQYETETWLPNTKPFVIRGSAVQRRKIVAEAREWDGHDGIRSLLIINWEGLAGHTKLAGYGGVALKDSEREPKDLNGGWIRTVVADEVHKAKDPKAKQTRALWGVGDEAQFRFGLTGTPIAEGPEDLWAAFRFIRPGMWTSKSKYRDRYTLQSEQRIKGGKSISKVIAFNPRTEMELDRIIAPYTLRRTKAEVLPFLPPKAYETRWVELDTKQRRAYDQMGKKMMAALDSGLLVVTSPLQLSLRLLQLTTAMPVLGEPDEEGIPAVISYEVPSAKVDALIDDLEDSTDRWVVFAQSRKLIDLTESMIAKRAKGRTVVRITGNETGDDRQQSMARFQNGSADVVLATFGAGSEGITLTAGSSMGYLQRSDSLVQNVQSEDRTHRIGQEASSIRIVDYIASGTLDRAAFENGVYKEESAQQLLHDPDWIRRSLDG